MPLSENIKKCRLANSYTQQQVAGVIGVDRTAYANYELDRGTPNIDILCKLARIFGVSLNSLLDYFTDDTPLSERITAERAALKQDDPRAIGYITPNERQLILLFRLSRNKEKILDLVTKSIQEEEQY